MDVPQGKGSSIDAMPGMTTSKDGGNISHVGEEAGLPRRRSSRSDGIRPGTTTTDPPEVGGTMTAPTDPEPAVGAAPPEHDGASATLRAIEQGMVNLSDTSDALVCPLAARTPSHDGAESPPARSIEDISKRFAPTGMDAPFQQLYRALLPCLTDEVTKKGHQRPNVSVFIQGPRGCGKSLLVQSCLKALRECREGHSSARFRSVFCSSVVHVPFQRRHSNAGAGPVVEEILRQLVEQAAAKNGGSSSSTLHGDLVRLRQSSFTNHLQLLNETLQMASTDGIPVLFVLDNVSRFPPLLLYHVLDRIAGSGTNTGGAAHSAYSLCLVAMATHTLTNEKSSSFIEKRISSRVEGTATMIHLPASSCSSQRLLEGALPESLQSVAAQLYENQGLAQALKRQERMGKSARWFCRLFYSALASWREEIRRHGSTHVIKDDFLSLVRENLEELGVAVEDDETDGPTTGAKRRRRLSPTASILQDLSVSQLLLVLAATRIVARGNRSKPSASDRAASGAPAALTLHGMLTEVMDKLYRGNPPPNATSVALQRAFLDLLDAAVLRPAGDHSGIGPYQYYEREDVRDTASWEVLMRVPLHLTLDIYRDVLPSLEGNELSAPMAVLEWGKKLN